MTDPNAAQIVVNSNPVPSQVSTGVRDAVVIISTASAMLGLAKNGDLNGILALVQTPEALTAISIVIGAGVVAYRQWLARHETHKKVAIAAAAPEDVTVK